jgi:glutamate synthase (NADPH/NADH) small chain
VFEALHELGGVLRYGIPEFRLPKSIVRGEIEYLKRLGVEMRTNMLMGRSETIDELFEEGFDSVIIASGAGLPKFYNIPGENLGGIYSSNEYLIRVNLMGANDFPSRSDTPVKSKGIVAVIGARGIDSARAARRLGAKEVHVFYGWKLVMRSDDIRRAREEGIRFHPFTQPLEFSGDGKGWVKQVKCIRTELILDKSFRKKLVPMKGTEFVQDADLVVIAKGQDPNTQIANLSSGIEVTAKSKTITVDPETYETTRKGVFAIGDVASGAGTAIEAIADGKKVAEAVSKFLA